MSKKTTRKLGKKRTAVARPKRVADTQPTVVDSRVPDPLPLPPTVFVVMGHRGGSHGVIGLYATRERAQQEADALVTKAEKHGRGYIFTIDERQIHV